MVHARRMDLDHLNLRVRDPGACRAFYERHFRFRWAFDAEGGHFLRNDDGFLLAVVPSDPHHPLPPGFHIGFRLTSPDQVAASHRTLREGGARVEPLEDHQPEESYVSFRCWDPDDTEIEVFWDGS